jgi:predicted PurR-regulated permease PerM
VPPALHQIGHALVVGPPSGTTGVREHVLTWLQHYLKHLPTGTQLVHPIATYGHKATDEVVAIFFTLAAAWYLISEHDSMIELLTALAPESRRDQAREMFLAIDRRLGAYTRLAS